MPNASRVSLDYNVRALSRRKNQSTEQNGLLLIRVQHNKQGENHMEIFGVIVVLLFCALALWYMNTGE
jgi:hypothetical protein